MTASATVRPGLPFYQINAGNTCPLLALIASHFSKQWATNAFAHITDGRDLSIAIGLPHRQGPMLGVRIPNESGHRSDLMSAAIPI